MSKTRKFDRLTKAEQIETLLSGIVYAMRDHISSSDRPFPNPRAKDSILTYACQFLGNDRVQFSDFEILMSKSLREIIEDFKKAIPDHKKYHESLS